MEEEVIKEGLSLVLRIAHVGSIHIEEGHEVRWVPELKYAVGIADMDNAFLVA